MAHPRVFKGMHFNHNLDPGGNLPATPAEGIQHRANSRVTTHLRTSPGGPVAHTWSFTFLKYWSGAITRCHLTNPVLTGPMTGCILCTYVKGGHNMIAHIGTADSPQDPRTVSVKAAWTTYKAAGVTQLKGRKPTQVITQHDVIASLTNQPITINSPIPQIWGYFINANDAWALLIRKTVTGGQVSHQILTARPMQLLPWAQIPGSW